MNSSLRKKLRQEFPEWHKQPLNLTVGEIENPLSVLEAFFDCYHLPQARACLKEWLEESLRAEDADGASLVYIHDLISRLVEANWLIFQQKLPLGHITDVFGDNNLQAIISLIVAAIAPERMYMISKEPIDLLIVISDQIKHPLKEYERILEMTGLNNDPVYFSLHKSGDLRKQVGDGHIFYNSVCIPANIVYDNGQSPQLKPNPANFELVKAAIIAQFDSGMKRALSFLDSAKYHQLRHENEMCAFMLHQAAELSLRAFARAMGGIDIRTHEITALLKYASRFVRSFAERLQKGTDQENETWNLLDKAYKNARYSDDFEITKENIQHLFEIIMELLAQIQATFAQRLSTVAIATEK